MSRMNGTINKQQFFLFQKYTLLFWVSSPFQARFDVLQITNIQILYCMRRKTSNQIANSVIITKIRDLQCIQWI